MLVTKLAVNHIHLSVSLIGFGGACFCLAFICRDPLAEVCLAAIVTDYPPRDALQIGMLSRHSGPSNSLEDLCWTSTHAVIA